MDLAAANAEAGDSIYYAQGFRIETHADYTLVQIKNPWNKQKILQTYTLVPKSKKLPDTLPEGVLLRTPLEKTVAFSSVVCGMLNELQVLPALAGIAEPEYVPIPEIQERCAGGTLQNIGRASQPNIEKLMLIEPDALFTNPVNEEGAGALGKLAVSTIPCLEWQETHPLGQAEWIRLIGLFFNKKALADSLFFVTVQSYNEWKDRMDIVAYRPTVFMEKKYGDFWYMPGGKSYFAYMLEDAGANYVFKDNTSTGSVPFAFETILDRAGKADFWLFKYYDKQDASYLQLEKEFSNYALFDAYKKHKVYGCNTMKNAYYIEIPLHPDWLLKDLIFIFHPEALPEYSPKYYHSLLFR
ncbi:iron ABC transporter substrate-binding protein [Bacteroidia bacterium]|nr:iron ABC transporter substrate-binding protein [Bacteroidia bacterium]